MYIESIGPLTVAVSVFGGYAQQKVVLAEAASLELEVDKSSALEVDPSYGDSWFFAGYDSPFHLVNRHNEIWLPVEITQ